MAVFRAKEAFALPGPIGRVVRAGDLMSDGDPEFKGRAHLFEQVEDSVAQDNARRAGVDDLRAEPTSETATAEPNSKRSISTMKRPSVKPTTGKADA